MRDEDGQKTRKMERWERKTRHWGLHGNKSVRIRPRRPRDLLNHYYSKWWVSRDFETELKWRTIQHSFFCRDIPSRIERRARVEKLVEADMRREYPMKLWRRMEG